MTWEIAAGIIALAGFVGSAAVHISRLSKTLGVLDATLRVLDATIKELKQSSNETHGKMFQQMDEHGRRLNDHETRIQLLEVGKPPRAGID